MLWRETGSSLWPAVSGENAEKSAGFQHKLATGCVTRDWLGSKMRLAMIRKRNRKRPMLSFQERLSKFAQDARAAARTLPPGAQRHELLLKARQGEAAANIDRWLSSPGLQEPK